MDPHSDSVASHDVTHLITGADPESERHSCFYQGGRSMGAGRPASISEIEPLDLTAEVLSLAIWMIK